MTMTSRPFYPARFDDPEPQSFAAFLFTAVAIVDDDPDIELWMPPFPVTPETPRQVSEWAARANPILQMLDDTYRQAAVDKLRLAGIPSAALANPSPALAAMTDEIVNGWRAAELAKSKDRGPPPAMRALFNTPARMIAGVFLETRGTANARHMETARLLNRDAARRSSHATLDRSHVLRARRRYCKELANLVSRVLEGNPDADADLILRAEVAYLAAAVNGLELVWSEAKRHFPHLLGRQLALTVNEKFDLKVRLWRALDILDQRRNRAAA
jgi:hypothetical protein